MKFIKTLAMLAVPALFAASCGGVGDLLNLDGGSGGVCPAGTTLYRVQDGPYSTQSVTQITDTCNTPPLAATELTTTRYVTNNLTAGTVQVNASNNTTILGTGPVKCNVGALTSSIMAMTATCQYQTNRSSQLTLTADNTFTLQYSETRNQYTSVAGGGGCVPPAGGSCTISFTANMKM
jgi:hypothetical protein